MYKEYSLFYSEYIQELEKDLKETQSGLATKDSEIKVHSQFRIPSPQCMCVNLPGNAEGYQDEPGDYKEGS